MSIEVAKERYARLIDMADDKFETDLKHQQPYKSIRKLLRKMYLFISPVERLPMPGYNILDFDWKNLIVVDACRADLYERVTGVGDSCLSVASNTHYWFNRTFENKNYSDIIYLSANATVSTYKQDRLKQGDIVFYKLVPIWWYTWNEELRCVLPSVVTQTALQYRKKYPDKKLLIHYLQPHKPFIGDPSVSEQFDDGIIGVWDQLRRGIKTKEEVWQAYEANLRLVMKAVRNLVDKLDGKTVITSDHGNMVGEYGFYGHLPNVRLQHLVKVPFEVVNNE